jgi:mono/diheme cytochrome c family protein
MKQIFLFLTVFSAATVMGADLERGKTIYSQLCFTCHGPHLEGGIGPALKDDYWQHGSSPEAILKVINKGIEDSEMIPYEAVFSEADRISLRDFIVSEQEGLRETVRSKYPREPFNGKRFTPELFDSVESLSQTPLPENGYYFERYTNGVIRGTSKLYIKEGGQYQFEIRPIGRTSIFVDGEEIHYSDEKTEKDTHFNKTFDLTPGIHDLEIFHEEEGTEHYRFHGTLDRVGGKKFALNGRGLAGSTPKVIRAKPGAALVARKRTADLPPRALLCVLPNRVIVAYNPVDGRALQAWHSAEINQTPSLRDRGGGLSVINGIPVPISGTEESLIDPDRRSFLRYEIKGEAVHIVFEINGEETRIVIAPEGAQSFTLSVQ